MFKQAKRTQLKLRIAIGGPTGSGKTLGALRLAHGLCEDWTKIFVVDTENDSALAYAADPQWQIGQFMHASLKPPYTPQRYVAIMQAAAEAGAQVLIVDTLTHEWAGAGGLLEQHAALSGNSFTNWAKVNPQHQDLIDLIVNRLSCHTLCTLRAKMKHAQVEETDERGNKKTRIERLGVEPIMRPGTEYEFMLYLELQRQGHLAEVITKRGSMLPDMRAVELTEDLGRRLRAWADSGEIPEPPPANGQRQKPAAPAPQSPAKNGRPWSAGHTRSQLQAQAARNAGKPNDRLLEAAMASLSQLIHGNDQKRRSILAYLFGHDSARDLTAGECAALLTWIGGKKVGEEWIPSAHAIAEADAILHAVALEQGQIEMPLNQPDPIPEWLEEASSP